MSAEESAAFAGSSASASSVSMSPAEVLAAPGTANATTTATVVGASGGGGAGAAGLGTGVAAAVPGAAAPELELPELSVPDFSSWLSACSDCFPALGSLDHPWSGRLASVHRLSLLAALATEKGFLQDVAAFSSFCALLHTHRPALAVQLSDRRSALAKHAAQTLADLSRALTIATLTNERLRALPPIASTDGGHDSTGTGSSARSSSVVSSGVRPFVSVLEQLCVGWLCDLFPLCAVTIAVIANAATHALRSITDDCAQLSFAPLPVPTSPSGSDSGASAAAGSDAVVSSSAVLAAVDGSHGVYVHVVRTLAEFSAHKHANIRQHAFQTIHTFVQRISHTAKAREREYFAQSSVGVAI